MIGMELCGPARYCSSNLAPGLGPSRGVLPCQPLVPHRGLLHHAFAVQEIGVEMRGARKFGSAAAVLVLVSAGAIGLAAAQTSALPEIVAPSAGEVVDQGMYTVRGRVAADPDEDIWVVYAVDVSGSTLSAGFDCDGSGTVDAADDLNGDSELGEVLDCEIAGLIALNTSLAAVPGSTGRVHVAVVPFGNEATVADVGGSPGQQDFVAPTDDLDDGDRDIVAPPVQVVAISVARTRDLSAVRRVINRCECGKDRHHRNRAVGRYVTGPNGDIGPGQHPNHCVH